MIILDAESANEFVRSWNTPDFSAGVKWSGKTRSNIERFRRTAKDQEKVAILCGLIAPGERTGHEEAARVLRAAADRLEAELGPEEGA